MNENTSLAFSNTARPMTSSDSHLRTIPSTSETIPVIGLGTWNQFDVGSDRTERAELTETLSTLARIHNSIVDSSPMYGRAESVVGDLSSGLPGADGLFFASKVWTTGREEGRRQIEESMRRMRRERMDLMQVHNLLDWRTQLKTLRDLKEEGRVSYIGVTHYAVSAHDAVEEILRNERPDFVQINYSVCVRNAERSLFRTARENGVAVIVNMPFEAGDFFRRVRDKPLPARFREMGAGSWAQFALLFVISHPDVTCVIPGTSRNDHLLDNLRTSRLSLPGESERKAMAKLFDAL